MIYVKLNEKIAMNPFANVNKPTCRHCNWNFGENKSHNLVSNLIMPTLLPSVNAIVLEFQF